MTMSDKFGENLVWFLADVAAADDDQIEDHWIDIYGEIESGADTSCQVDIRQLCAAGANKIKSLTSRITELESMLDNEQWVECADRLPDMGVPVLAMPIKGDEMEVVYRVNGTPNWGWVNQYCGDYYATDEAWFKSWKPLSPPKGSN